MRTHPKLLVLSVTLTSALSLFMTGCNKPPNESGSTTTPSSAPPATSMPPPSTTMGTELDDSVVTTKVKSSLLADDQVKGLDIAVETQKGEVQLSGFVDNQAQLDRAIQITRQVEGVKNVMNKMSLKK